MWEVSGPWLFQLWNTAKINSKWGTHLLTQKMFPIVNFDWCLTKPVLKMPKCKAKCNSTTLKWSKYFFVHPNFIILKKPKRKASYKLHMSLSQCFIPLCAWKGLPNLPCCKVSWLLRGKAAEAGMLAAVTCSSPLLWISDSVPSAINFQLLTSAELRWDKNARTSALAQNSELVFIPGSGGSGNAWAPKGGWWIAAYSRYTVLCSPFK